VVIGNSEHVGVTIAELEILGEIGGGINQITIVDGGMNVFLVFSDFRYLEIPRCGTLSHRGNYPKW